MWIMRRAPSSVGGLRLVSAPAYRRSSQLRANQRRTWAPHAGIFGPMANRETASPKSASLPPTTQENLEILSHFNDREQEQISGLQSAIERVSGRLGSPAFFAFALLFIVAWMAVNAWGEHLGWRHFDAPPFLWLQGLVSCIALLLTVAVLIRQNRMSQMAEHRAHLDLQINLLTEQKVTKVLQIIDELSRDLTALRGRPDAEVSEMTKPADAHALMHAIKEKQQDR